MCDCQVINPVFDRPASRLLRKIQIDYDRNVRNNQALYQLTYRVSDSRPVLMLMKHMFTALLSDVIRNIVCEINPHAILSTYHIFQAPLKAVLVQQELSIPFLSIVTDLAGVHRLWFEPSPDLVFVGSDPVRSQAIAHGISPERVILSGIPVDPDFAGEPRSKSEIRSYFGWDPDLPTLLIVGSRRVNRIYNHLIAIDRSGLPVQVAVVAGGDEQLYRQVSARNWRFPLHLYAYTEQIPQMMRAADVLISKAGGLIVAEGLASGLPLLLVDFIPGQESGNVNYICENRAGILVQRPVDLVQALECWLDNGQIMLKSFSENSSRIGNPFAAGQVAKIVWEAAR